MKYIYIAGPYTLGDVAVNVRNAMMAGLDLMNMGFIPFVPHLSHWLHLLVPVTKATASDEPPFKPIGIGQLSKQGMKRTASGKPIKTRRVSSHPAMKPRSPRKPWQPVKSKGS